MFRGRYKKHSRVTSSHIIGGYLYSNNNNRKQSLKGKVWFRLNLKSISYFFWCPYTVFTVNLHYNLSQCQGLNKHHISQPQNPLDPYPNLYSSVSQPGCRSTQGCREEGVRVSGVPPNIEFITFLVFLLLRVFRIVILARVRVPPNFFQSYRVLWTKKGWETLV